jgi:NADPH:quinone reductase-like Zn-dependent oxidoreductase
LQLTAPREYSLREMPMPQLQAGKALMRVDAVTTCPQWDLHLRHNEPIFPGHQFIFPYALGQPGHEGSGEIVALGEGVESLKIGDRVSAWRDAGHRVGGCYHSACAFRRRRTPVGLQILDRANGFDAVDRVLHIQVLIHPQNDRDMVRSSERTSK